MEDLETVRQWYAASCIGQLDPYPETEPEQEVTAQRILDDLDATFGPNTRPRLTVWQREIDGDQVIGSTWVVQVPIEHEDWRLLLPRDPDRVALMLCERDRWAIDRQVIQRALTHYCDYLRSQKRSRYDEADIELSLAAGCLLVFLDQNQQLTAALSAAQPEGK